MAEQRLYCTFYVGRQFYGVPIGSVREVLLPQPLTTVPLAPAAVAGLINLRGQIITALDVRTLLRSTEARAEEPMNLVVRNQGSDVSLLVDRIGEVIDVAHIDMSPPPETLQGNVRAFLQGIFPLADSLLLALDIARLLEDESCLRATQAGAHGVA